MMESHAMRGFFYSLRMLTGVAAVSAGRGVMYRVLAVGLLMVLGCSLRAVAAPDALPLPYLIYGSAGQPFQGLTLTSQGDGIISDVVFRVFAGSPYRPEFRVMPVRRIKRDMYAGREQVWVAYGFRSWTADALWGRQHLAAVDLFHYHYGLMFFDPAVAAGRSAVDAQRDLPALAQLVAGRTVAVISGFQYGGLERALEQRGAHLIAAEDQYHALSLLERRRADFYLGNLQRNQYFLRHDPRYAGFPPLQQVDLQVATGVTLMFGENTPAELRAWADRRLGELVQDGYVAEVLERYGMGSVEPGMKTVGAEAPGGAGRTPDQPL